MYQEEKKVFTGNEIHRMNFEEPWRGCIKSNEHANYYSTSNLKDESKKYKLYATGECSISNGRTYVYLPSDLKITDNIKSKYNLI